MMKGKLIEHDGNGHITINTWLAFGTFFIFLLITITSLSVYLVGAQNDAKFSLQEIQEQKSNIKSNSIDINKHESRIVRIETQYENIMDALNRIEGEIQK